MFSLCCIAAFVAFGFLFIYLVRRIREELDLYRFFSEDDSMRGLLMDDPKRFHISVIYLMTYMTRTDDDSVQVDKLNMIVRYIREICPLVYLEDILKSFADLTARVVGSGKNRRTEAIFDVAAFMRGSDCCFPNPNKGSTYANRLHGTRMAQEISQYLSETDRLYVMYLLNRMVALDNVMTTGGKRSEMAFMGKLCLKGLKVPKDEFEGLFKASVENRVSEWYRSHFAGNDRYPDESRLANLYPADMCSYAADLTKSPIPSTSHFSKLINVSIIAIILLVVLTIVFFCLESDLMSDVYPLSLWVILLDIVAVVMLCNVPVLDSERFNVLRTKLESKLQWKGLVCSIVGSACLLISLYYAMFGSLTIWGNSLFREYGEGVCTAKVTDTHKVKSRKSTSYYADFPTVYISNVVVSSKPRGDISFVDKVFLNALASLPLASGVGNGMKTMDDCRITSGEYYDIEEGSEIELTFKRGYYGYIFFDGHRLKDPIKVDADLETDEVDPVSE